MMSDLPQTHTPYWDPDPYGPLETPPWHHQQRDVVEKTVKELLTRYSNRELPWEQFIDDRHWGMKQCLWRQHHKNDQRHKNLGRPFWSVAAYRAWCANISRLSRDECFARDGHYAVRTLQVPVKDKLRAFLRHEHVVPKNVMIQWLLREPDRIGEILDKNVCCVLTKDEDARLNKQLSDRHPDVERPWRRYEGMGIKLLYNPDWPDGVLDELKQHQLIDDSSYRPL